MAFNSSDLAIINSAIATGELTVEFEDGRRVEYRSINDLLKAKSHIQKSIDEAAGRRRPRSFRINVSKGA